MGLLTKNKKLLPFSREGGLSGSHLFFYVKIPPLKTEGLIGSKIIVNRKIRDGKLICRGLQIRVNRRWRLNIHRHPELVSGSNAL